MYIRHIARKWFSAPKILIATLTIALMLLLPFLARGMTIAELQQQIQQALAQVATLQAQLTTAMAPQPPLGTLPPITSGGIQNQTFIPVYEDGNLRYVSPSNNVHSPLVHGGITITTHLDIGSTGTEVTRLQTFLAQDPTVYPEGIVSGYFGSLTENAVARYQQLCGILPPVGWQDDWYGCTGPRTREALRHGCVAYQVPAPSVPHQCALSVNPSTGSAPLTTTVQAQFNTLGSCDAGQYNIQTGDGVTRSFFVPAGQCTPQIQSFPHSYLSSGNYTLTCSTGPTNQATASVVVGGGHVCTPDTFIAGVNAQTAVVGTNRVAVRFATRPGDSYEVTWGDNTNPTSFGSFFALPTLSCLGTSLGSGVSQTVEHTYGSCGFKSGLLKTGSYERIGDEYVWRIRERSFGVNIPCNTPTPQPPTPVASCANRLAVQSNIDSTPPKTRAEFTLNNSCAGYSLNWGDGSSPVTHTFDVSCSGGSQTTQSFVHTYTCGANPSETFNVSMMCEDASGTQTLSTPITITCSGDGGDM